MSTFVELGLAEPLLRAVAAEGYTTPTPIQVQAIPHVLAGKDLLGCAQTGTGKTAAFALPMLQRLSTGTRKLTPRNTRALVLAPTRELALQIDASFRAYGKYLALSTAVVFGGVGQGPQVDALARGVDVLVATPGRLLDLCGQGHISLGGLSYFVLDEADRMLDMGFLPDVRRIIGMIPPVRQSLFFSATLPPVIIELAGRILKDPVQVAVAPPATTVEAITQRVVFVHQADKRDLLERLVKDPRVVRALVFTKTKHGANRVVEKLQKGGVEALAIHGNKSQGARVRALTSFRSGETKVLVATDLAARGLDVDGVSHVINYDLPMEPESYVHRIGRTARAGASGIAITFVAGDELGDLRVIERLIGKKIPVAADHIGIPENPEPQAPSARPRGRPQGRRRR